MFSIRQNAFYSIRRFIFFHFILSISNIPFKFTYLLNFNVERYSMGLKIFKAQRNDVEKLLIVRYLAIQFQDFD